MVDDRYEYICDLVDFYGYEDFMNQYNKKMEEHEYVFGDTVNFSFVVGWVKTVCSVGYDLQMIEQKNVLRLATVFVNNDGSLDIKCRREDADRRPDGDKYEVYRYMFNMVRIIPIPSNVVLLLAYNNEIIIENNKLYYEKIQIVDCT